MKRLFSVLAIAGIALGILAGEAEAARKKTKIVVRGGRNVTVVNVRR